MRGERVEQRRGRSIKELFSDDVHHDVVEVREK